jgi:hypothetical protein
MNNTEFGYEADLGIKAPFFEAKVELEAGEWTSINL